MLLKSTLLLILAATAASASEPTLLSTPEIAAWAESSTREKITGGNQLQFLKDGPEFFPVRLAMLRAAGKGDTVDLQTFLWCDDEAGIAVADELVAAAKRGARVRAVVDWGNKLNGPTKIIYKTMQEGGVTLMFFNPPWWGPDHINNMRMHEKVMVINGAEALLGGANLCDEYMLGHKEPLWHDFEIHARGPVAARVQHKFDDMWNWVAQHDFQAQWERQTAYGGVTPIVKRRYPVFPEPTATHAEISGDSLALFEYQRPYVDRADAPRFLDYYSKMLGLAREKAVLYMPYYNPPKAFHKVIIATAQRGVKVTIFTNSPVTNDNGMTVVLATTLHYKSLLDAGVKILEVPDKRTLHGKAMLIDEKLFTMGSHNRDNRSFYDQGETSLLTDDAGVIRQFGATIAEDLASYTPISQEIAKKRLKGHRLKAWFGALFEALF